MSEVRILFITPVLPGPAYGRRPYNFIKTAAADHEVSLIAATTSQPEPDDLQRLQRLGVKDIRLVSHPKWKGALCAASALWKNIPFRAAYCFSKELERTVDGYLAKHPVDLVHIDRIRLAHLGKVVKDRARCVVDFTDSLSLYYERTTDYVHNPLLKTVFEWERRTIPSYERRVSEFFDMCLLCSDVDAEVVGRSVPKEKIRVIPNMVDTEEFSPHVHEGKPRLVFTGTWTYFPNRDSLFFYDKDILPLIHEKRPDVETLVIGARPDRKIRAMQGKEGIAVIGPVDSMAEALCSNDVFMCPIRFGAGIRNKLLEAMSCGMACVSTTLGAEGIPVEHGRDILLADDPQRFAELTVVLLQDESRRRQLGHNARELIRNTHSEKIVKKMTATLYDRA